MMIEFEIAGNGIDPDANPVPKLKMTGRQYWTDKAQAYVVWKEHVRTCFVDALMALPEKKQWIMGEYIKFSLDKPIMTGKLKCLMEIYIEWKDNRRGDPENIFGSIADALFDNDKFLAGSFDFNPEPTGAGRVRVRIFI